VSYEVNKRQSGEDKVLINTMGYLGKVILTAVERLYVSKIRIKVRPKFIYFLYKNKTDELT
jgi:hypothetical protein